MNADNLTTKQMFSILMEHLEAKSSLPVAIHREEQGFLNEADRATYGTKIHGPEAVYRMISKQVESYQQEVLVLICLNTKNSVIWQAIISVGTLNVSLCQPREIFRHAIEKSASSIVLVHNHPSGDPTPSHEDKRVTQEIAAAGKIIGIALTDHIVIGTQGRWVSMREQQVFS